MALAHTMSLLLWTIIMQTTLTASYTDQLFEASTQNPPQTPKKNSNDGVTSSHSVLQLNVINRDGSLTSVVYPGKQVALELQSAAHGRYGVPAVTQCTVTNPLHSDTSSAGTAFSQTLITRGCGMGDVLPMDTHFSKSQAGYSTPFFTLPPPWAVQSTLLFACDVIICADSTQCQQPCPPQTQNATASGLYDVTVLLESQIVASCPQGNRSPDEQQWNQMFLPECFPLEPQPSDPSVQPGTAKNFTAGIAAGNDANKDSSVTTWLAGHVHYVIIIGVLGLIIVVFMFATFCKMVAMQRQVTRCNKIVAKAERERTLHNHQDTGTQTPRPLPRIPNGRSPTSTHQSGTERETATSGLSGDNSSGPQPLRSELLLELESSLGYPPFPVPQARGRSQVRRQSYDVPPNHDRQIQMGVSVGSSTPQGLFRPHNPQRGPEVQAIQVPATPQEKNSPRPTAVTEANDQPLSEEGWQQKDRLGSFTGITPNNSNNNSNNSSNNNTQGITSNSVDSNNTPVKTVILGMGSPRKRLSSSTENGTPVHEVVTAQMYYNTPAPCSEGSSVKELHICQEGGPERRKQQRFGSPRVGNSPGFKSTSSDEGVSPGGSSPESDVIIDLSPQSYSTKDRPCITVSSVEESTRL